MDYAGESPIGVGEPFWARILEKQGIATVVALILLGMIWGIWQQSRADSAAQNAAIVAAIGKQNDSLVTAIARQTDAIERLASQAAYGAMERAPTRGRP